MPYDPVLVQPMREELTSLGVQELTTAGEVDQIFGAKEGTTLLVINSVCGCAAGNARPAVALAMRHATRPDRVVTVFAGQDLEATARARTYIHGYGPSSPSMALFQGEDVVLMLERRDIEGRHAEAIAADLIEAFDRYCATGTTR